jgi:hypothetical protein
LFENLKEKRSLGGSRHIEVCEDIIKMDFKEIEYEDMSRIQLAQDKYNGELCLTL